VLAQKLILSYGSKIAIQFIQICASIVVARIAGPTVLGTVAFGLAFVSMFLFLADLGFGTAHIKMVSEGQDIAGCISTYSILKIATTVLFFVVVLCIFIIQKYVLNVRFESAAHEYVIIIMLLAVTTNELLRIPLATFAGKTEQAKQDIPDFVRTLVYQILRVVIVLLGYKAVALAFGRLVSTLFIIPFVLYLFRDYPKREFDRALAARYLKIALPVIVLGMSTKVLHFLDRVLLQYFTNSEQVGYYTAGFRIGELILLIASSVGMLFFPVFSKAISNGNLQYVKSTIEKFERFSFLFVMPAVIFLSLYSGVIIRLLLGSQYLPSIPIMAIINLAMFTMVLSMPYGNVLTGMGYFKLAAILSLINLFLFVGLVFLLSYPQILNLGAVGVAVTVFVSNFVIGFLFRIFAKRKCPILSYHESLKFFAFTVINFFSFLLIYEHFSNIYGSTFKIIFIPMYFGITYCALVILGMINREDLRYLKKLVDIKKLGRYVKGELGGKYRDD